MIQHFLTEPRPLGLFSPRRSPPSYLGSLCSVRLRKRMCNHGIHCVLDRQQSRDVIPALALDHALRTAVRRPECGCYPVTATTTACPLPTPPVATEVYK